MWSRTGRAWRARWRRFVLVVVGVDRVEVRLERHLRVDDDALAARELDDEVGPQQPAVVVALALPARKSQCVEHAGELDDALQLHLAPAAAHVRGAERRDEVARLRAEPLLSLGDRSELLVDGRRPLQALLLERLRLLLEPRRASPGSARASPRRARAATTGSSASASPVSALSCSSHWPLRSASRGARAASSRAALDAPSSARPRARRRRRRPASPMMRKAS